MHGNKEYTGAAFISRKTSKSYKDHRKYIKPEEEWVVQEGAHPERNVGNGTAYSGR